MVDLCLCEQAVAKISSIRYSIFSAIIKKTVPLNGKLAYGIFRLYTPENNPEEISVR